MKKKSDKRNIFLSDSAVEKFSNFGVFVLSGFVFWQMFFVPLLMVLGKYFPMLDSSLGFIFVAENIIYFVLIFFLRYQILTLRDPYAAVVLVHMINFRIFFAQSIFWLLLSSVHWLWIGLVMLAWVTSEVAHRYEKLSVDNDKLVRAYALNFSKKPDGDITYTPDETHKNDLLEVQKPFWIALWDKGGMLGLGLLVLVGPFLFMRSQLYREDFDPRFAIAGAVMFLIAFGFRRFYTRSSFGRRALLLKQQGKF